MTKPIQICPDREVVLCGTIFNNEGAWDLVDIIAIWANEDGVTCETMLDAIKAHISRVLTTERTQHPFNDWESYVVCSLGWVLAYLEENWREILEDLQ